MGDLIDRQGSDLISRQAAIDAVLADVDDGSRPITEVRWWNMGLTRASEILKGVPSAQTERRYDEWCTDCKEYDHEQHCCPRFNHVIRTTLQDVRKKGKWIRHEVKRFDGCHTGRFFDECSECGKLTPEWRKITEYHRWNYCPNCGLLMEVSDDKRTSD